MQLIKINKSKIKKHKKMKNGKNLSVSDIF